MNLDWTLTTGEVSQIRSDYKWNSNDGRMSFQADVIQMQISINPGNSGGPLLNDKGELIGITTFFMKEAKQIGFAIANSSIINFL